MRPNASENRNRGQEWRGTVASSDELFGVPVRLQDAGIPVAFARGARLPHVLCICWNVSAMLGDIVSERPVFETLFFEYPILNTVLVLLPRIAMVFLIAFASST